MNNPRELKGVAAADYVAKEHFAWPGGYELYAIFDDGDSLCYDCCRLERDSIEAGQDNPSSGWRIIGLDTTETCEAFEACGHCGRTIYDPQD